MRADTGPPHGPQTPRRASPRAVTGGRVEVRTLIPAMHLGAFAEDMQALALPGVEAMATEVCMGIPTAECRTEFQTADTEAAIRLMTHMRHHYRVLD